MEAAGQAESFTPEALTVPATARLQTVDRPDLLGGVTVLEIDRGRWQRRLEAIPYYAWNNRGLAPMAVWLKRGE